MNRTLEVNLPLDDLPIKNVPEKRILSKDLPVQEVQKSSIPLAKKASKRRHPENKIGIEDEPTNKVYKKDVPMQMDVDVDHINEPVGPVTRSVSVRQLDVNGSSEEEAANDPVRKSQQRKQTPRHLDDFVPYSLITETGIRE